jgi:hypothetical protein
MRFYLIFLLFLLLKGTDGQILNNSFENATGPDLSNWEWTIGAEACEDAPEGGGSWCIQVTGGSTQGYLWGYAYQRISEVDTAHEYILSASVKALMSANGVFFGKINNGTITLFDGVKTSATSWTTISIQSSFLLTPGDTALVVLDAGIMGGVLNGLGNFDLVKLESVAGIEDSEKKLGFNVYPNPFTTSTTIKYELTKPTLIQLTIYNHLGEAVEEALDAFQLPGVHTYEWSAERLPEGMYFAVLRSEDGVSVVKMLKE